MSSTEQASKQALLEAIGVLGTHGALEGAPRHALAALVKCRIFVGFLPRLELETQDLRGARFGSILAEQQLHVVVEKPIAVFGLEPFAAADS